MLQGEHSAILSTYIKLPFVIKSFVLSILSDRFTQVLLYMYTNGVQKKKYHNSSCYFGENKSDQVDWLQSLKQFFINVSYHILVASLTLVALFLDRAIRVRLAISTWYGTF